jgi:Arc/MetJ-type ribon-helix-helix transcriptional regulator
MNRTTVTLPQNLADCVKTEARLRRKSVSQIVREALEQHFHLGKDGLRELPFEYLVEGGDERLSERVDEILAESWADDIDRDR